MEITYDSQADALSVSFKKGEVFETVEISPEVVLDIDKNGAPIYLEIIGASEKIGKKQVSEVLMRNLTPVL
jgi:uncharacterized protein YuzE